MDFPSIKYNKKVKNLSQVFEYIARILALKTAIKNLEKELDKTKKDLDKFVDREK